MQILIDRERSQGTPSTSMRGVLAPFLVVTCIVGSSPAIAVTIDGRLDPEYGPVLVTQSLETSDVDAVFESSVLQSRGSELDQAFGFIARDTLFLLVAGNLGDFVGFEPSNDRAQYVLLDTGAAGQNEILPGGAQDLFRVGGLTLDAGFHASYALVSSWLGGSNLSEEFLTLPPGSPGTGYLVGSFSPLSPQGSSLTGGPNGIQVGIDNSNLAGVTFGCDASSGAGVTTGIEWAVPLAAIGHPTGCVRACAFIFDGNFVTNQVLGPVPVGTCSLGSPASVSFAAVPGEQFFTICSKPTPTRKTSWGELKSHYR